MLITQAYREQNAAMHLAKPHYGNGGYLAAARVERLARELGATSILDYGCGKGSLAEALRHLPVACYDPAIPGRDEPPVPADLVVCSDVMEHIEPDCLSDVIRHLHALSRKALYLEIATVPALKHLPDGRNAHLIVEPAKWWLNQFSHLFALLTVAEGDKDFCALFRPRAVQ